jgi:hypothetical protein
MSETGLLERFAEGGEWSLRLLAATDALAFDQAEISWETEFGFRFDLDPEILTAEPLVQMRKIVLAVAGRKIDDFAGETPIANVLQAHIGNSVALLELDAGSGRKWSYITTASPTDIVFTFTTES